MKTELDRRISRNMMLFLIVGLAYLAAWTVIKLFFDSGPGHVYTAEWVARHNFLYLWIPALLAALRGRRLTALASTAGTILGIPVAQLIGAELKRQNLAELARNVERQDDAQYVALMNRHMGVWIWLLIALISLILPALADFVISRRRKRPASAVAVQQPTA